MSAKCDEAGKQAETWERSVEGWRGGGPSLRGGNVLIRIKKKKLLTKWFGEGYRWVAQGVGYRDGWVDRLCGGVSQC